MYLRDKALGESECALVFLFIFSEYDNCPVQYHPLRWTVCQAGIHLFVSNVLVY